jgi:hypothetical protein
MKTKIYLLVLAGFLTGLTACNDDFLEQYPQTALTPEVFFRTVNDLQLYVNGLNNAGDLNSTGWFQDHESDNVAFYLESEMYRWLLTDLRSPENAGGWTKDSWNPLRAVNLMLTHLDNVEGNEEDINNYVGIAHYYRAWFYIEKIKSYGEAPWIDKPLSGDDPQLYEAKTPRAELVQHVMDDLDFAVENIKADMGNKTRIHKYCALALLSRFALYEGTFRKYHSELGLSSTANEFLQKSITASEQLMNSGQFEITGTGTVDMGNGRTGAEGFRSLFSSLDLSGNSEIIKWTAFDPDKTFPGIVNWSNDLMSGSSDQYSLSRSLQESFLTKDGRPYSTVPGYDRKELSDVFVDRDPRLMETFAYPGAHEINGEELIYHITRPIRGGYNQIKYFMPDRGRESKNPSGLGQYNGLPNYRYGEVLLNYAEAKAELGQFTQDVANRTVNKLRDRVGMPHFNAEREVDATLRSLYPNVSDVTILALRRERRVELAGEGHRLTDINRWYAGKVFELPISKQGIYVPLLPYVYDATGDGVPDLGIAASESDRTNEPNVTWYYQEQFYIDDSGYIRNREDQNRRFDEPKDYYRPIPVEQTVLNPQLTQPYGW